MRCDRYFNLWKKEPNFCGLGKSACREIEKYLVFVDEFTKKYPDITSDVVYLNVQVASVKDLLRFNPESPLRKAATQKIYDKLCEGKSVTRKAVNKFLGIEPKLAPLKKSTRLVKPASNPIVLESGETLPGKIKCIYTILPEGQMNILFDVQKKFELDDEYAALIRCIIIAGESLVEKEGGGN